MIVSLSISDTDKILQLYGDDFPDGWNKNMFLSSFTEGRFLAFGKIVENALVGVITITRGIDDSDIESIFVKPDFRRKGLGKELMHHALTFLHEKGADRVLLEVRKGNDKAINLYKNFDFKEISVRKKYYSDGEDAIVMLKE